LMRAQNCFSFSAIGSLYFAFMALKTAVPRLGPASHPSAAQLMLSRPSVMSGSSGIWLTTGSASPVLRATDPAAPEPTEPTTLNPCCHLRRALRSLKKVSQLRWIAVWSGVAAAAVEALRRATTGSAWRGAARVEAGLTFREEEEEEEGEVVERARAGDEDDDALRGDRMLFRPAEYGQAVVRRSMG